MSEITNPKVQPNTGERRDLSILLLCDKPRYIAATLHHHIGALSELSRHTVHVMPMLGTFPLAIDLRRFDVVVVHWSLIACHDSYLSPRSKDRISDFQGLKVLFIQDEYRFIEKSIAALRKLGIHVLFTCVPEDEIEKVYPTEKLQGVVKVNTLTGYVDKSLLGQPVPPLADRKVDVSYRARKLPAWLGAQGQEKSVIGERFKDDAARWSLICDISSREEDRLYGEEWIDFLTRSKAVLGVESGASVFDFDGSIQAACESDLQTDPELSFDELRDRYFKDKDGLIRINQISPRCFEAAALRTLMILYEGYYSGLLIPWRHYIPLRKDHSNMEEVVSVLRDPLRSQAIVDAAYQEVARNPANSFETFVEGFDGVLEENVRRLGISPAKGYSVKEFAQVGKPTLTTCRNRIQRDVAGYLHVFLFGYVLSSADERTKAGAKRIIRKLIDLIRRFFNLSQ